MRREIKQNIKKLTSLVLTAAMVLCMNGTVFAAQETEIVQEEYVQEVTEPSAEVLQDAVSEEDAVIAEAEEETTEDIVMDEIQQAGDQYTYTVYLNGVEAEEGVIALNWFDDAAPDENKLIGSKELHFEPFFLEDESTNIVRVEYKTVSEYSYKTASFSDCYIIPLKFITDDMIINVVTIESEPEGMAISEDNFPDKGLRDYIANYKYGATWNDETYKYTYDYADTDRNGYISDDEMYHYNRFVISTSTWDRDEDGSLIYVGADKIRSLEGLDKFFNIGHLEMYGLNVTSAVYVPESAMNLIIQNTTIRNIYFDNAKYLQNVRMYSVNLLGDESKSLQDLENKTEITSLEINDCSGIDSIDCPGPLQRVAIRNNVGLKSIKLNNVKGTENYNGYDFSDNRSLENLAFSIADNSELVNVNLKNCSSLKKINISGINSGEIDLSGIDTDFSQEGCEFNIGLPAEGENENLTVKCDMGTWLADYISGKAKAEIDWGFGGVQRALKIGESPRELTFYAGDTRVYPKFEVTCDNECIEFNEETGRLVAKAPGTANVTVSTLDGRFSDSTTIDVIDNVKSVKLDKATADFAVGSSVTLKATVDPKTNVIADIWWHIYDSEGNELATNDGFSITKTKPAGGVSSATVKIGRNVIAGSYKVVADVMSNYDNGPKYVEGVSNYISAVCDLKAAPAYKVAIDKSKIYYGVATDSTAKFTVSNIVDPASVKMTIKDAEDYDECLKLTADANDNKIWRLTFADDKPEKDIVDIIRTNPKVTVEIMADGSMTERTISLVAMRVDVNIGKNILTNCFDDRDVLDYAIDTNSEEGDRLVSVAVSELKGRATVTCNNADVGVFAFSSASGVATLKITKNVTGNAVITIKADGREKKLNLDLYKKNKVKLLGSNNITEFTKRVAYDEGVLKLLGGEPATDKVDFYVDGVWDADNVEYIPVIKSSVDGTAIVKSVNIDNSEAEGNHIVGEIDYKSAITTGTDTIEFYVEPKEIKDDEYIFEMINKSTMTTEDISVPKSDISDENKVVDGDNVCWKFSVNVIAVGVIEGQESADIIDSVVNKCDNRVVGVAIINDKKNYSLADLTFDSLVVDAMDGDKAMGTFEWVNPAEVLKANNATPVQFFPAVFRPNNDAGARYEGFEDMYCSLPVAVSQITGIGIEANGGYIEFGNDMQFTAFVKGVGFIDNNSASDYMAAVRESFNIKWKNDDTKERLSSASFADEIYDISVKGFDDIPVQADSKLKATVEAVDKQNKKLTASSTVTLTKNVIDKIVINAPADTSSYDEYVESWNVYSGQLAGFATTADVVANRIASKESTTITLDVKVDDTDTPKVITWTSTDTSIATVKENADGDIDVTVLKKAGSTVIKGVAKDIGKTTVEFYVDNHEYAPVLTEKTFTVNYNGSAIYLPFVISNGNKIKNAGFEEESPEDPYTVEVENIDETNYVVLKVKNPDKVENNKSIKKKIKVETYKDRDYSYEITIKGVRTDPKLTFTQKTKARIFELADNDDQMFSYKVASSTPIISMDVAENKWDGGTENFGIECVSYDPIISMAYFKYHNLSKDISTSELSAPIKLDLEFAGLSGNYNAEITNVGVTYGVKVLAGDVKLEYLKTQSGDKTFTFFLKDKKGYLMDTFENVTAVTLDEKSVKAGFKDAVQNADGSFSITYSGNKRDKFTMLISSDDFYYDYPVVGSVAAIATKELALKTNKLTINTAVANEKSYVQTNLFIKNDDATQIEGLTYGTDKAGKVLFESGYIDISFNSGENLLVINKNTVDSSAVPKAGTYKIIFKGKTRVGDNYVDLKPVTLSLVISNKAPTVTVTTKGTIDPLNAASGVVVTPKLSEISSPVNYFVPDRASSIFFNTEYDQATGTLIVKANEGATLSEKEYRVGGKFYLMDGTVISWDGATRGQYIPVKVKQVNPKLIINKFANILYKSSPESPVTISIGNDKGYAIREIIYEAPSDAFVVTCDGYDADGRFIITGLNINLDNDLTSGLKPATYKINCSVYFENAADNAAPMKYSTSIVVK